MKEATPDTDLWPFELPKVGTWFYFLIIGYPLSIVILLLDSVYTSITDQPIFIQNLPKFSMTYNGPPQEIKLYERSIGQKIILGFSIFIIGTIILTFSLILSIFGAFKQAKELQTNIVTLFFPISLSSDTTTKPPQPVSKPEKEVVAENQAQKKACFACGESNELASEFCIGCGSNLPAK